jgi:hypothetical protein
MNAKDNANRGVTRICPAPTLLNLSIYLYIYIYTYTHTHEYIYIYKNGCMLFVCMFGHNSGTPGAISTKLGTHMAVCMCKNLMHILYIYFYLLSIIFSREDGVGGLHAIHPPPQGLPIAATVMFTQIAIEATARYVVTFTQTGVEATTR